MKIGFFTILSKIKDIEAVLNLFLQLYRYLEKAYKNDEKIKNFLTQIKEKFMDIFKKDITKE